MKILILTFLVNLFSNGARAQVFDYTEPAISHNGKKIAYCSSDGDNNAIYVASITGANPKRIVNLPTYESSPSWSHDDTKIIFYSMENDGKSEMYVVDENGENLKNITNGNYPNIGNPNWIGENMILFSKGDFPTSNIFIMNEPDITTARQLTDTLGLNYGPDLFKNWLVYSVFSKSIKGLQLKNLRTGQTVRITESGERPRFSPSGKWIAYQTRVNGVGQVHLLKLKDRFSIVLTEQNLSELPAWSPDGKYIYYQCKADGKHFSIWRMTKEGKNKEKIVGE